MIIRDFKKEDGKQVCKIFSMYWNDEEFLDELTEKLGVYIDQKEEYHTDKYRFYVADEDGQVVGIAGLRKAPDYLSKYAETENPAELYIIASKYQTKGIGNFLGQKTIEKAKNLEFTEILCYSPETHNNSWRFYEKLGFTSHGTVKDPDDGYPGMLWEKII